MRKISSFHMSLGGRFEDAFLYMGQLVAVRDDRTLVQADLADLISRCFPDPAEFVVAEMFLLRNDFLEAPGVNRLLGLSGVRAQVEDVAVTAEMDILDDEWLETDDFSKVLPDGDVLDLKVYAQRLFVATTKGMLHSDLIDDDNGVRLRPSVRRTDARCLSITAKSGSVVASCGDDGLIISFDEFRELGAKVRNHRRHADVRSLRAGWLGYHLVNYSSPAAAETFRSKYNRVDRKASVITGMKRDDDIIAPETSDWANATFTFNDYNTFFTRFADTSFTVRTRSWHAGRLGRTLKSFGGFIKQPVSVTTCLSGIVVETFDQVLLVREDSVEPIFDGQAVAVRTFPNSRHYRNIILIITDESLQLISPLSRITPRSEVWLKGDQ